MLSQRDGAAGRLGQARMQEAISRAILAWTWIPARIRPCRTWCTAEPEKTKSILVYLRDDELELLAIYLVRPERMWLLKEETDVAQGMEWAFLNPEWQEEGRNSDEPRT